MTNDRFQNICSQMREDIFALTPYDSGNLANEATKLQRLGDAKVKIFVDEEIAPYFRFVNNEPMLTYWSYQRGIKDGKIVKRKDLPKISHVTKNRNYHYFEKAVEAALENLAKNAGGKLYRV